MQIDVLKRIESGLKYSYKISRLLELMDDSTSDMYYQKKYFIAAKLSLMAVIKWFQRNTDILKKKKLTLSEINKIDPDYPDDDLMEIQWELSLDMTAFDDTVFSKIGSWQISRIEEISPMAREMSKECFEKTLFTDCLAKKFKKQFYPYVHGTLYESALDEEGYIDTMEIRVNSTIPKFFKKIRENLEIFTEQERKILKDFEEILHYTISPFYSVGLEAVNQVCDDVMITSFLTYNYGPNGEEIWTYLYRPEQAIRCYLLDEMIDYMKKKYPHIFEGFEGQGEAA